MIKNSQLQILNAAKHMIETGWTKGAYARDSDDRNIDFLDDDATCFCTLGAIHRATSLLELLPCEGQKTINLISDTIDDGVIEWNDDPETTKEDVLKVFDVLIVELSEIEK